MASPAEAVLLHTVVPIIGAAVALAMYASPVSAVLRARRQQSLGDLQPLPFAVTVLSCACWNGYGFVAPDYNMFLPNLPGLAIALWTTVTCHALATSCRAQDALLGVLCASSCVVLLLGVLTRFVLQDTAARTVWGVLCNVVTIAYYAAPASSAVTLVNPAADLFASLSNGALWVCYGAAVGDLFVWLPNGIGVAVTLGLLALSYTWPPRGTQQAAAAKSGAAGARESSSLDGLISGQLSAPLQPPSTKSSGAGSTVHLIVADGEPEAACQCSSCPRHQHQLLVAPSSACSSPAPGQYGEL